MPVEDHAIHPSTQKGIDFRYGCWNHQRAEGYWACVWSPFGKAWVPHRMSLDCRYDLSHADYACEGCKHKEK